MTSHMLLLLAVVLVTLQGSDGQTTPPSTPMLPTDPIQINVEATIYRTNLTSGDVTEYTSYFEEYRDSANNRGLSVTISKSMETRFYYDLVASQGMSVTRNIVTTPLYQAHCTTTNFTDQTRQFGGFGLTLSNGRFVIANVSQFFQWTKDSNPRFVQKDNIRGIPATQWIVPMTSTQGTHRTSYNLTYWFSEGHHMPHYGTEPVPLRIEMIGFTNTSSGAHTYRHVYDFSLVAPLGDKTDSFFATPPGVYCPNRVVPRGSELTFPDEYSVREESINDTDKTVSQSKTHFDYNLNMTRVDFSSNGHTMYGDADITIVHDFNHNLQMSINRNTGKCNVTRIDPNSKNPALSWDVTTGDNGGPKLKHTRDIFGVEPAYQGKRTERGVSVDVWSFRNVSANGDISITELWVTAPIWSVRSAQARQSSHDVWMGFLMMTYNNNTHAVLSKSLVNVFDQYYGPLTADTYFATDVFNVPECYPKDATSTEHLGFLVSDPEQAFVKGKVTKDAMIKAIRKQMATLASVSPTRITDVEIFEKSQKAPNLLQVWFLLHAKLIVNTGPDLTLNDLINSEVENSQAVTLLEVHLADTKSLALIIPRVDGRNGTFVISSLLSNDEGDVAEEIAAKGDDVKPAPSYTAAAMAGLGIGMLILGAVLTVAVGAILWIKRFDINIPYLTQNNEA